MSVTDEDRQRAQHILNTASLLDMGGAIAQALADERARTLQPFKDYVARCKEQANRLLNIFLHNDMPAILAHRIQQLIDIAER